MMEGVYPMNKNLRRLAEPGATIHMFVLVAFAVATLLFGLYELAAIEAGVILLLVVISIFAKRRREKQLAAYIESITYETENAKNNTLMNFPLPIAVFRLADSVIVWGNDMFFDMCGEHGTRMDASIARMVPQFSGKWLLEGKTQYPTLLELSGRKYQLHGNIIRSDKGDDQNAFMGITYWVDVTDYDKIRQEYEHTRPVAGIVIIDNLEEMIRNQPDRVKNDIRDAVEDKLKEWCDGFHGILRRYDRDRYLVMMERQDMERLRQEKFKITDEIHQVESPTGIGASISIGLGIDGENFGEVLQFADMASELALSRGGDQTVIKNSMSFEFYGGRGYEVEKRTKVKSRVMSNALAELVKDSSRVLVMGHRFADLDSVGAAVGVCCFARQFGVKSNIVIDMHHNAAQSLIESVRKAPEYRDAFISPQEAMAKADSHTLLVVVDTNRPEQVEDRDLLLSCIRVAAIDHHRVAATYIEGAALNYHEPYASSASELVTELLQYIVEPNQLLRAEAEALLAGIVLDTKNFTMRTGGRTFEAAAFLRRSGADTAEVKKLYQNDLAGTITKYAIIQNAKLYRDHIAIAATDKPVNRVIAAQAADELLNIIGIDTSFVLASDGERVNISARSMGDTNVQVILEQLGGGGNAAAAGGQVSGKSLEEVTLELARAIDRYLET